MSLIVIDCGTTNTRVYRTDRSGKILGTEKAHIGVRNTSMEGSSEALQNGIREMIAKVRNSSGDPVEAILSFGMITSEIGLRELKHNVAPCGMDELASGMTRVEGLALAEEEIPVWFVRGVRNPSEEARRTPFRMSNDFDFMRGEETQIMGMIVQGKLQYPATVLVLSSHSKYIAVNDRGQISGSFTTASGQIYAAIRDNTFVGKSVCGDGAEEEPVNYFDPEIVDAAMDTISRVGLCRGTMFPRFQDVLADTKWYERKLYFEAALAADDLRPVGMVERFDPASRERFYLIGQPERCRLYRYLLQKKFPGSTVVTVSDGEEIDSYSIHGILALAEAAQII